MPASHHVLLFSAWKEHRRGDVIPTADIGTELERLINLQAIRPATDTETGFEHLELSVAESGNHSLQSRLVIRERELAAAKSELEAVQAELNAIKAARTTASIDMAKVPSVMQMTKDKDKVIGDLTAQLKVAQNQIALLKGRNQPVAASA